MVKFYKTTFDSQSVNWDRNSEYNLLFLHAQERYMTDILHARGYVFLRDVLENLGLSITKDSVIYGWAIEKDECIDFEIKPTKREGAYSLCFKCYNILDYI